jgi:hypothetical protein
MFSKIENDESEKINPRGSGIGLKNSYDLSKELGPDKNKGIKVKSEYGKGSAFYFFVKFNVLKEKKLVL